MIQIKIETLGLVFCFGRNIDLVIPMDDRCCEFVLVFVSNKTMIQCRRRAWSASRMSASPWEPCVGVRSPRRGGRLHQEHRRGAAQDLPEQTAPGGGHALRQAEDSEWEHLIHQHGRKHSRLLQHHSRHCHKCYLKNWTVYSMYVRVESL